MKKIYRQVEAIISPVYMVGGSVRDELMGIEPKDYDFITPHEPDVIEQHIRNAGKRPYLMGKRFGTVGVKLDGYVVEITTFRTERYRKGSRKPSVEFVNDIREDLGRRDFTINAIAKRKNEIIDPFDGQQDIKRKVIQCVGDGLSRFTEDPLRMLRAARFSGQFGFAIVPDTFDAARELNYKILEVSKERWVAELDGLLLGKYVDRGLNDLMDMGLLSYIIPELFLQKGYGHRGEYHVDDLWEYTVSVTARVPPEITLRWAALLHEIAQPFVLRDKEGRHLHERHDLLGSEMVMRLGKYLRWSNDRIKGVSELVRDQALDDSPVKDAKETAEKYV